MIWSCTCCIHFVCWWGQWGYSIKIRGAHLIKVVVQSVSYNKHFGGKLVGNVENFVFTNILNKHSSAINIQVFKKNGDIFIRVSMENILGANQLEMWRLFFFTNLLNKHSSTINIITYSFPKIMWVFSNRY